MQMIKGVEEMVDDWVSSLPTVYLKLKELIDDPGSSFKDFADVIHGDPALAARLLKLVNSSFYGFASKVETITHALNIVGVEQLNDLVLSTTIKNQFQGIPRELIDMESFWRHSIACGVASRRMAIFAGEPDAERFYVAGMLHDIGSLVIYKKLPLKAKEVLLACKSQNALLTDMERKVLGFDHAQVGGALLRVWKLPALLVESVSFHHNPFNSKTHRREAGIVHVADGLAYRLNLGSSGNVLPPTLDARVLKEFEISEVELKVLETEIQEPFERAVEMFLGP